MSTNRDLNHLKQLGYMLHLLLLDGDLTATAQIAETFMPLIVNQLRRRFSNLPDPDLIDTAVEDAFINYFNHPAQYDPTKLHLVGYLRMAANGDLLNLLKQNKKNANDLRVGKIVELDASTAEHEVEIPDDFDLEGWVFNRQSPVWEWLPQLFPDPTDQEIILLMLEGVRETEVYANALGISSHLISEQAALVKRHKDRLKKKLQRNLNRSELSNND